MSFYLPSSVKRFKVQWEQGHSDGNSLRHQDKVDLHITCIAGAQPFAPTKASR